MEYKTGDLLYVKSTDEPVVVIGSRKLSEVDKVFPQDVYNGSGVVVVVRRPIVSESGVQYKFFDFLAEELESYTDQGKRLYNRIKERQSLAMDGTLAGLDPSDLVKN